MPQTGLGGWKKKKLMLPLSCAAVVADRRAIRYRMCAGPRRLALPQIGVLPPWSVGTACPVRSPLLISHKKGDLSCKATRRRARGVAPLHVATRHRRPCDKSSNCWVSPT